MVSRLRGNDGGLQIGKYTLSDCLADGPGSAVYKAHGLGRNVALKLLKRAALARGSEFHRAGRVAAAIDHPNIAAVWDAGENEGLPYLVMELVDGQNLIQWRTQHSPLPIAWACECARQAALGLEALRVRKIVHRNLQPSHILVAGEGLEKINAVKIISLGMAAVGDAELRGSSGSFFEGLVGAADYIAPEQANDPINADIRSDIFSLGCTLFELLTGQVPFTGPTPLLRVLAKSKSPPQSLLTYRADAPAELDALLTRMLARDPRDRPQTPAELVQALTPFVHRSARRESAAPTPAAVFKVNDADQFLATLEKSRLLSDEKLSECRGLIVHAASAKRAADQLVDRGLLNQWQALRLLCGESDFQFGPYQLLDHLGQGATATVYQAIDEHGGLTALKILDDKHLQDSETIARFQRGGEISRHLKHPHLVTTHLAGQINGKHVLAMEFVAGHDLAWWIRKHSPLKVDWAVTCIRQAALGLHAAHEQGIVHRDVKPANLMVMHSADAASQPFVKVMDLGLARLPVENAVGLRLTMADHLVGTPDYMAPEQFQDARSVDGRADLYSLGVTLFEALAGRLPYSGRTPMARVTQRLTVDPRPWIPFVRTCRPACPPWLRACWRGFPSSGFAL